MTPDRYHISTLEIPDTRVLFTWGESEFPGMMKVNKQGNRKYRMILDNGHKKDLPEYATPHLWRPEFESVWPHELPEPSRTMPAPQKVEEQPAVEDTLEAEHTSPLGKPRTPPKTLDECEQRIIRAWRTMNHPGVVRKDLQTKLTYYPEDFLIAADVCKQGILKGRARVSLTELGDFHFGAPESSEEAIGVFNPTTRDMSDWDYALDWIKGVDGRTKRIFARRFAVPRWSWAAISEDLGRSRQAVEQKYRREIKRAFERALKG
jgi:hypothetical protein